MIRAIIESPYGSTDDTIILRNIDYFRMAMRDCLLHQGESPYASHGLYTQDGVLDDRTPNERLLGIHAGLEWAAAAHIVAVYCDFGVTDGMKMGIAAHQRIGTQVSHRKLPGYMLDAVLARHTVRARYALGIALDKVTPWPPHEPTE